MPLEPFCGFLRRHLVKILPCISTNMCRNSWFKFMMFILRCKVYCLLGTLVVLCTSQLNALYNAVNVHFRHELISSINRPLVFLRLWRLYPNRFI